MTNILKDKVSIVTGGGSGIGKAIAITFASEGSKVVIGDINIENANEVANYIKSLGYIAIPVEVDVSINDDVKNLIRRTLDEFGKIDILVNSAGIQTIRPFIELPENEWQRVVDVNLKGTFLCSQGVAREMIKAGIKGIIINISSIHGSIPRYNEVHYDASKAGVDMLTKEMALELAEYGIRVNCIAPGIIATPMNKEILNPEGLKKHGARVPLGRVGDPKEVARLALFLASEDANYITGGIFTIDGGLSLKWKP